MKDVLKCIIAVSGEQCVMMISIMQQRELFAALSDSRMYRHATFVSEKAIDDILCDF